MTITKEARAEIRKRQLEKAIYKERLDDSVRRSKKKTERYSQKERAREEAKAFKAAALINRNRGKEAREVLKKVPQDTRLKARAASKRGLGVRGQQYMAVNLFLKDVYELGFEPAWAKWEQHGRSTN